MTSFPEVLCWETSDHTWIVVCGVLIGLFFVFPFLTGSVFAVVQAPRTKDPGGHYQRWRFLLYRFRPDVWWWGIVFLLRQLFLAFSTCVPADSPHWQVTYVAIVTVVYLIFVACKWPWKNGILNMMDVASMLLLNGIISSSTAFVETLPSEKDVDSFVFFHLTLLSFFGIFVAAIAGSIVYWMNTQGLRGEYGSEMKSLNRQEVATAWANFVQISANIDSALMEGIFLTFNEFDLTHVVKAMGSFQSLDPSFGKKLAARLNTVSHSAHSIDNITVKVREANTESLTMNIGNAPHLVLI
eukprot:CAMPEP_0206542746 /NCGR_PEP_ID=MMETSP0325_2-20121206/10371_1 /ASSEMBLY_ACC=CAM_ASM_000347 /TAXON_ID=2866 /ORGANISM="Crypthecodinium cohnii, Strain Seligo" /LENGTH=297 /DNA_ID=CAMNT_0054040893 /DNA_START=284 /DNA_END=1178 /DNA_ORIENTATION=-